MSITYLQNEFPKVRNNGALTGIIPIEFFDKHERLLRAIIKENNLRVYYRGKRINRAKTTRRSDAYGVVLYQQSVNEVSKPTDSYNVYFKYALAAVFGLVFGYMLANIPQAVTVAKECIDNSRNTMVDAIVYECIIHYQGE